MPKISVIVPVYNVEKYLHRCVDSILAQTFTDFELLLVNDGSKDSSGVICDEYAAKDSRVKVFHKENGGVSSARNLGLDNAKGEWVTFVDSDDWVSNTMYEAMFDKVLSEDAEAVYCDIKMCFATTEKVWKAAEYVPDKVKFLNNFIASEWTSLCNVLAKRILFEANKVRCPMGVAFCEDYHVSARLMYYAKKVCYLPESLYCYNRVNETSALHSFSTQYYDKERWCNLDVINFFKKEGAYEEYAETLSWRLLKSEQEYVLDKSTYNKFLDTNPDSHRFIWSCPYINTKIKVMMWSLSHNLRFIAELFLLARKIKMKLFK